MVVTRYGVGSESVAIARRQPAPSSNRLREHVGFVSAKDDKAEG
jgi:hypothetical protein